MKEEQDQPFQLKNIYNQALLNSFAEVLKKVWSPFPVSKFMHTVFDESWPSLELKQRTRHISKAMRAHLPGPYAEALVTVEKAALHLIAQAGNDQMVFEYGFMADFVEHFGVDDPDISIPALETITRFTSAEFAVRPYLIRYPERMYAQMQDWATHESYAVRRLASEGFRSRLPWGMGVPALKRDPSPILVVMEMLKTDPVETVRRSVANSLNDISKDFPELALELAQKWQGKNAETDWVVRHGCRTLLKKGNPVALQLFGFHQESVSAIVNDLVADHKVKIGERLEFSFNLQNTGDRPSKFRVEYQIEYLTSTGKVSTKVFRIKEFQLDAGQVESFKKYQRFQDFTTRKHYPGKHRISILVNGLAYATRDFEVITGSK